MTDTRVTNPSSAVENLKQNWSKLDVVGRAAAVKSLCDQPNQKISLRALARELGCSLTHVRDLYLAASAPVADRLLARQGKISSRELTRRARAAKAASETQLRASAEAKRAKEAEAGCKLICKWMQQQELSAVHGENVVGEARRILALHERTGTLPSYSAPKGTPVAKIIEVTRPKPTLGPEPLEVGSVA